MKIRKEHKAIFFFGSLFTVLLLTKGRNIEYAYWIFCSLFSVLILFYVARLFNFPGKFKRADNNIWKRSLKQDFQERLEDNGIFIYENLQFSFVDSTKKCSWTDIKTIIAYKEDLFTYDEIYLRILFTNRQLFVINESTPGWYKFIKILKQNISSIPDNWDYEITIPAFATNMTVLFDKDQRENKIAIEDSYS